MGPGPSLLPRLTVNGVEDAAHRVAVATAAEEAEATEGSEEPLAPQDSRPLPIRREMATKGTRETSRLPSPPQQSSIKAIGPLATGESPSHNVEGRLSSFTPTWLSITSDRFLLNIIHNGYSLVFDTDLGQPPLSRIPLMPFCPRDNPAGRALSIEVEKLLTKRVIEVV